MIFLLTIPHFTKPSVKETKKITKSLAIKLTDLIKIFTFNVILFF